MTCVIDISLLQFGQLSIVGTTEHARLVLMTLPFARQNVAASKRLTLDRVPVSLKSKSWNWLGRFATAARSPILLCANYPQESSRKETGYYAIGCLATQQLPSDNHFVICGPKLALVLLTEARPMQAGTRAGTPPRFPTGSAQPRRARLHLRLRRALLRAFGGSACLAL
jgi:hypothetical protein